MIDVYFYLQENEAENVLSCGLKLSEWFDKEVIIQGESRRCISALLNPKDDSEKYKSEKLRCLRLELAPEYCYIADGYLYRVAENSPEVMDLYLRTITPAKEYVFGTYRFPECLVTSTIISEQIRLMDKRRDSPILYENSEDLYISNIIESYKEEHDDFNDILMYYFYSKLAEIGKVDKIVDSKNNLALFLNRDQGSVYSSKIPDLKKIIG